MPDTYYNNLKLTENNKFKNNNQLLSFGLDEVQLIYENIEEPVKNLIEFTGLSDAVDEFEEKWEEKGVNITSGVDWKTKTTLWINVNDCIPEEIHDIIVDFLNEKELPIGFRPKFDPEFKPEFKPEPVIISPPPRCGKTQLLKAIESLKPRCEKCNIIRKR